MSRSYHTGTKDPVYTPTIARSQHSSATGEAPDLVEGVVAGARVTWVDDSVLGLHRRAILQFDSGGPQKVLIVKKPGDNAATSMLLKLSNWFRDRGMGVVVERPVAEEYPQLEALTEAGALTAGTSPEACAEVDLCVTLGGDGTVLHLASLFSDDCRPLPPVVSFAMGTLGFLTPFPAEDAERVLGSLLTRSAPAFCTLRTRRRCEVYWAGGLKRVHSVLNECLVDRGASPAMVLLEVYVDGKHVTTVQADGLIVAPPSGSTAYSMSAGGPMVAPSVPCTLITPVAPHSLSFRPIVVPENAVVEVHLPEESRAVAIASFDGRHAASMPRNSSIVCSAGKYALPMITRRPLDADWFEGITQKLRWTGSLRPLTRPDSAQDDHGVHRDEWQQ